ncbi:hypothetical protein AMST5_01121 [freshwater sediment metagenome]|uniref:Fatty acid hydroxylase domain-containing protein n=1 Tax=freshwater sediment metagenome TaxID=556182 RepID=A0AA48RCC4_9ZZZZ
MDINSAIRFSVKRVSLELFALGSVFSIYSLASSLTLAFCALAWRQRKRRGRVNLRAILRAVLAKKVLNHESFHADVKLLVLSVVFMPAVIGGLVISASAVSASVNHLLAGLFGSRAPVEGGDLTLKIVSTIILFLAYEIGYWVDHYLKHRVPFLWELHKLHHTADVLTPLTNFRNHPIDNIVFGYMLAIFIGGASGLLGWLYGRNPETFSIDGKNILFLCFLWTIGHLQHSEFWIPFRGVWGRIILSPAHHQIHHSDDPQHFNRNLGSVLAVWDWMFGTLEIPTEKNPRLSYGVQEEGVDQHSTFGILVRPALKSASELARALAGMGKFLSETLKSAMAPERKRRDA